MGGRFFKGGGGEEVGVGPATEEIDELFCWGIHFLITIYLVLVSEG